MPVGGQQIALMGHAAGADQAVRETFVIQTGGKAGDVLTLTPPLTIPASLLDGFADALEQALA